MPALRCYDLDWQPERVQCTQPKEETRKRMLTHFQITVICLAYLLCPGRLKAAPASRSTCATAICPFQAALESAVYPCCCMGRAQTFTFFESHHKANGTYSVLDIYVSAGFKERLHYGVMISFDSLNESRAPRTLNGEMERQLLPDMTIYRGRRKVL